MNVAPLLFFCVFLFSAWSQGFSAAAIVISGVFFTLFLWAWYLESKSLKVEASTFEQYSALLWRYFRLLAGALGFVVFCIPAIALLFGAHREFGNSLFAIAPISLLFGVFIFKIGFFGWSRTEGIAKQAHNQRKQKYGWKN